MRLFVLPLLFAVAVNAQECDDLTFLADYAECLRAAGESIQGNANPSQAEICDAARKILKCLDDVPEVCIVAGSDFETQKQQSEQQINELCGSCLAGNMIALTMNGEKMVKDLKVGDVVSVGNGEYEPIVWSTQHRGDNGERGNEHVTATFIGFKLENGKQVHLTANHFAQTTAGLILADKVTVGETFITNTGESTTVVAIDREVKKGAFNPQTPSQKIVVNGIVVSTRTAHSPQYMGTVFKVLAFLQSMTPSFVYNGSIEAVCKHVFEPLLFGEVSPSLYFSAAATVVIAGVLRKKLAA